MATDTLTRVAESMAPAPASTNFFDPTDSQNIISRYAGAANEAKTSDYAADAGSRLLASQWDRARQGRQRTAWNREDQDYEDKQAFKAQRGTLLTQIAQIDPQAVDYEEQRNTLMATLPPEAAQDDALQDIFRSKDQMNNQLRAEEERDLNRQEGYQHQLEMQKQRLTTDRRLDVLSQEERQKYVNPDGTPDLPGMYYAAAEKSYATKKNDAAEIRGERRADTAEVRAAKAEKDLSKKSRDLAKEHVADTSAFKPQLQTLREQNPGTTDADLKADKPEEYAAAQKWDSNQFESELAAARNTPTVEEFIAKGGVNLTPVAKAKRASLWEVARTGDATDAAPEAGDQPFAKVLDRAAALQFKELAKGDRALAEKLAREAGYSW